MDKEPSFSFKSNIKLTDDNLNDKKTNEINNANNNIIDSDKPDYFNNIGDSPKFNVSSNDIINEILDIPTSEMDFKNSIIHETEKKKTSSLYINSKNSEENNHAPGVNKDADKTTYINLDLIVNDNINNTNININNNDSNNSSNYNKNLLAPPNKKNSNKVLSNNAVYKSKNEIELPKKSHLEYLKIIKENKDPLGVKSSGGPKEIALKELSLHNKPHDMWTVINNEVYDLTMYIDYHPGGANKLMEGAGKDATDLFYDSHPWVNIHNLVGKLQIGYLKK